MPKGWPQHSWTSWRRRRTGHRPCLTSASRSRSSAFYRSLVYGIDTFRGLFNDRQLYVLGSLCEAVRAAHAQMLDEGMQPDRAVAVATYLGLCVDRIADYDSSFCGWARNGEFRA